MLSLAPPDNRSQKLDLGPLRHLHDMVHHLVNGLLVYLLAALGTVRDSHPGIQKPHIIINLSHGAHRGTGVPVRGLLVYGNGRRQPFYALHIRLLHLSQELAGIGGQGLHITPLPFRIDGVKSQ